MVGVIVGPADDVGVLDQLRRHQRRDLPAIHRRQKRIDVNDRLAHFGNKAVLPQPPQSQLARGDDTIIDIAHQFRPRLHDFFKRIQHEFKLSARL